jgi:hypothetical protein
MPGSRFHDMNACRVSMGQQATGLESGFGALLPNRPRPMKITVPECVLSTELQSEGVLLNLETGEYFGLDEVGLDMWKALGASGTLEAACDTLLQQYDVAEDVLADDLRAFVAKLAERKLVVVTDA